MSFDRATLRQAVAISLPEPEVRAKASAEVSLELIDLRLKTLKGKADGASYRERNYLTDLRRKLYPDAP